MDWNIAVDEAMFLGGLPKGEFLRELSPISSLTTRPVTSRRQRAMCLRAM